MESSNMKKCKCKNILAYQWISHTRKTIYSLDIEDSRIRHNVVIDINYEQISNRNVLYEDIMLPVFLGTRLFMVIDETFLYKII